MRAFAFVVALVAAPLSGQRFVVDAMGGGNFLDLPAAVAAVPDGATLLVRPGTYSQFNVVGKGITIIGDAATCSVSYSPPGPNIIQIANVPAGKRIVISGFVLGSGLPSSGTSIQVLGCAGSVVLRDLRMVPLGCTVQGCTDVHLMGLQGAGYSYAPSPLPPLFAILGSNVELVGCQLVGGLSYHVQLPTPAEAGSPAVTVQQSSVVIHACQLTGGAGSGIMVGPGGPALAVSVSAAVTILGASSLTGGKGGHTNGIGGYAPGGNGIDCDATSRVLMLGGTLAGGLANGAPYFGPVTWQQGVVTPIATTSGAVLPNATVRLNLTALPSVPVVYWLGQSTWFQPYPQLPIGVLTVQPQIVLGPLVTDAQGALTVPLAVPASWPGATPIFAQFATLDLVASTISVSGTLMLCGVY